MLAMQSSAYAYDTMNFYYDSDNDGYAETNLKLITDYYSKSATISSLKNSSDKVVIPAVVSLKY